MWVFSPSRTGIFVKLLVHETISEVGGVSPTGKSSSELRVCVLRCVRDVRASDVERSTRVCECESECESEWESERESKRESAVAKANLRKILRSALRPASRGSLCPRCVVWSRLISMLISIMVVNASSPPHPQSPYHTQCGFIGTIFNAFVFKQLCEC